MVALAPALRRVPALRFLSLSWNRLLGDEGAAALVAPPPPPAGAPPPTGRALTELRILYLDDTQITDTGCATLAAALRSGALPALQNVFLFRISASAASKTDVFKLLVSRRGLRTAERPHRNGTRRERRAWSDLMVLLDLGLDLGLVPLE